MVTAKLVAIASEVSPLVTTGQESFISFDVWTALFVLINTVTMFLVLKHFLFKPVLNMIKSRQNEIDSMYKQADEARESAGAMQKEYEKKLSNAMETGDRIVKEAVVRGQNREEEIIRQANVEALAIRDKAVADAAQEKKKAINNAKDEISGMAIAIAEKIVGRQLMETDQDKLFDEFVDQLGEGL